MTVTGSRKDLRVDGLCDARQRLIEAVAKLKEDGVGPNVRDGWSYERVKKYTQWVETLIAIEREIQDEAISVADEE